MSRDLALPVSHHVALRETGKSLAKADQAPGSWALICSRFVNPTKDRFRNGERLPTDTYAKVVAEAGAVVRDLDPVALEEFIRQPTRTRPKGEQHEILAVTRMGIDAATTKVYGLAGLRLYANRKRVEFDYDMLGLDVTGHLLERTMQRDLASWSGRFREVDRALADASGLAVVWRYAFALGALKSSRIAMPLGDGLMLGNLLPSRVHNVSMRVAVNRNGSFLTDLGRSPFHVPDYQDAPDMRYLRAAFATAVSDDLMTLRQVDLRDALNRFRAGNAAALGAIGRAAMWRGAALSEIAGFDALYPRIEGLARDLANILGGPDLDEALNRGHREDELAWGSSMEGPVPAP